MAVYLVVFGRKGVEGRAQSIRRGRGGRVVRVYGGGL